MGSQQQHYDDAQMGASYYPGRDDDYYMPPVVAPVPQRYEPSLFVYTAGVS